MEVGVVKWFNNAKGFGFISAEGTDADIFAHYSVIEMEGYRSLKAGQKVQFEVVHGDKDHMRRKLFQSLNKVFS
ncbi:TPA: cold shock domain-containing protein CspD [Pasteurella multocida]|nr:cold shock domain-containing protein CspD [Pasteurella multocida]